MDVVSDMHVMRARVDLSDVRHSVLSAQLSGVSVFFLIKIHCTLGEFVARPPHSPWGDREKKKLGNGGISPPPLPPCQARRRRKKSNVQRRAATWGPLLPRIPQVLRHRSRALPTTPEVAEFVATAGMLGPQMRWSSPCWRAHL